ncbi:transposase [uncultured Bartonella sp.]|uniref:transposase n=1 Tax=uncultured Bartonella sp. TaxID=104108 RepID=UPI0025FDD346|nr:transposase [uncultured Bartonella sp.]
MHFGRKTRATPDVVTEIKCLRGEGMLIKEIMRRVGLSKAFLLGVVVNVTDTVQLTIDASGCNNPKVKQPPRLLSDNGPAYIAEDLEKRLKKHGIVQLHGAPMHP